MSGLEKSLPETILAPRTDPVYNCHTYLTKVPLAAIYPFIEAFTAPGEVVADFFAGSGMTGLAALTRGRSARLSDISALGKHIFTGYSTRASEPHLLRKCDEVVSAATLALGELYKCERAPDGSFVEMVRTVWSFVYVCPGCESELVYFEQLDGNSRPPVDCPSCDEPFSRRTWDRGNDIPVRVVVPGTFGRQADQPVSNSDRQKIRSATLDPRLADVPSLEIEPHREMYNRSGLRKSGLTETASFFSARNAIALLELWHAVNEVEDRSTRQALRFAFTAILPRASKRYQWSAKRPLNAQNQTYYIAPVYYEWNVFDLFARKVRAVVRAQSHLFDDLPLLPNDPEADASYEVGSANELKHLEDESIDYVFVDPPFGSNIFYSDMSLFHEAWIGETTDHTSEAVIHTTGKRKSGSEERYAALLQGSFREGWRILKPGRNMTVVFGNSNGRIWGLVQRALRDAGFNAPVHVATLDKGQRSVKGLNSGSERVVTVDLVLTYRKPMPDEPLEEPVELTTGDTHRLVDEAVQELSLEDCRSPSQVYASVLMRAIREHLALDDLHLGDVLIALRNAGFTIDPKKGLLHRADPA